MFNLPGMFNLPCPTVSLCQLGCFGSHGLGGQHSTGPSLVLHVLPSFSQAEQEQNRPLRKHLHPKPISP